MGLLASLQGLPPGLVALVAAALISAAILYYLYLGFCVRWKFQKLQREGIPMMPHHPILGHLAVLGKVLKDMPPDAHDDYMMVLIQENWRELFPASCRRLPPVVYLDPWPFSAPIVLSMNPDVSAQFTQDFNLDKPDEHIRFLHPLTRNNDVSSSNGADWLARRKALNPAFSPQNIIARVPDIVDEVEVFADILKSKAGKEGCWGDVFELQRPTTLLTLDVIGRFSLDVRLHEQTTPLTPLSAGMIDMLPRLRYYLHIGNAAYFFSPWRRIKLWKSTRAMDEFLAPLIRERLGRETNSNWARGKTLLDVLARVATQNTSDISGATLVPHALGEIKHTIFAGHETTAFAVCWIFYILSEHPEVLRRVRAEVEEVLGRGTAAVAAALRGSPQLINGLTYTNAVIKEMMRIHTNVGTLRKGAAGFDLYGPAGSGWDGVRFPTEGCVVWDGNFAIHRDPDIWPRPLEFLPERWLVGEDDPLHPPRNAYRPFVQGARNCIGQHLAVTELKMVVALVVGELDVECAWHEWDVLQARVSNGSKKEIVWGNRLYQVNKDGPPHVKDGMPVHVRLRQPTV